MSTKTIDHRYVQSTAQWLKSYYFSRFLFSAVWVAIAFAVAKSSPPLAAIMLVGYWRSQKAN